MGYPTNPPSSPAAAPSCAATTPPFATARQLGCGISGFEVRSHDLRAGRAVSNANSAKAFWLRRTDGTATDFSFLKCVDEAFAADPDTVHAARVYRALRMAVDDQVLAVAGGASRGTLLYMQKHARVKAICIKRHVCIVASGRHA